MWGCQSPCAVIKTLHTNVSVCLLPIDDPIRTPPFRVKSKFTKSLCLPHGSTGRKFELLTLVGIT